MDNRPTAPPHIKCHEVGFKKRCADLCHSCWKWMELPIKDRDTGITHSEWMCADIANTRLLYNVAGEVNGAGRATEDMRNVFFEALPTDKKERVLQHESGTDPRSQ